MLQRQPPMLRRCLESGRDVDWAAFWPLRFWVITMGAISAMPPEKEWFVQELAKLLRRLGRSFWRQMEEVKDILWIDGIYERGPQSCSQDWKHWPLR
jgi:hypothetical protein